MGELGWTLAAVVQTPVLVQTSFRCFTMKLLLIFQRPIPPAATALPDASTVISNVSVMRNNLDVKHAPSALAQKHDSPQTVSPTYLSSRLFACREETDVIGLLADDLSDVSSNNKGYEDPCKESPQLPEYNGHVDAVPPTYDTPTPVPSPPPYVDNLDSGYI